MMGIFTRLFRRRSLDDDVREEIESHIAMQADLYRRSGMPADEALRAARRQFGNVTAIRERLTTSTASAGSRRSSVIPPPPVSNRRARRALPRLGAWSAGALQRRAGARREPCNAGPHHAPLDARAPPTEVGIERVA